MLKKKSFFITFEGIEGSGKSYKSKKLYKFIKKKRSVVLTREPGGSSSGETIRNLILSGKKNKFDKTTDALLYLGARNEHFIKVLKPAILNKQVIICDRFIDSTLAYQVYGQGVNKELVNFINKNILGNIKPDLTFILTTDIKKAFNRIKKRKNKNRYDKFSQNYYMKVQSAFLKIASKNKKRYYVLDNSHNNKSAENLIISKINKYL